ncbi:MAG: hypothetical protein IPP60_08475 [Sphingobacteriales bacterium]|nr:hypothetical protein [Sphingobacteriales bacterium]MCC6584018.1 hypothetical protein [Chitinophagales bacterium]
MYNQFNKTLYASAIVFLLSASIFVACKSSEEKAAADDAGVTTETTTATTETTPSGWQPYKESAQASIVNNLERIKVLKEKIKTSNTPNLDKLRQKRINELEDRNTALRAKIMDYKEDNVTTNLEQFKADIQKELDDMEKALKELDDK